MSTSAAATPAKRLGFFRFWLPILIVIGSAAWLGYVWLLMPEEVSFGDRVGKTFGTTMITVAALGFWFLFLGPGRWYVRLVLLALIPCALIGAISTISFSGDMVPSEVRFRWQTSPQDVLETYTSRRGGLRQVLLEAPKAEPTDFPEYRGSKRDGIIRGPALARDWKAHPPKELWKHPAGGGYAQVSIAGNVAVTIEQRRENEVVVAYNTMDGKEFWKHEYPDDFRESLGGPGPRATPTIADGKVYSLGAKGTLVCLDLVTGKPDWTVNILENNENLVWGMSGSPLVYDKFVVVNPGAQTESAKGRAVVAYDQKTGKVAWKSGTTKAGYSSPVLATFAGKQQILLLDGEILAGYDSQDGHQLWHYDWPAFNGINVAQPLVLEGDRVFISSGYNQGCALLHVTNDEASWKVESIWGPSPSQALRCKFASPVYYQGAFYGLDDGTLVCVDEKTGQRRWKGNRYGHGQILLSDDLLVIFSENGKLVLVQATPDSFRELGSFRVFSEPKNWNPLALANGKVFLRNEKELACYQLTP